MNDSQKQPNDSNPLDSLMNPPSDSPSTQSSEASAPENDDQKLQAQQALDSATKDLQDQPEDQTTVTVDESSQNQNDPAVTPQPIPQLKPDANNQQSSSADPHSQITNQSPPPTPVPDTSTTDVGIAMPTPTVNDTPQPDTNALDQNSNSKPVDIPDPNKSEDISSTNPNSGPPASPLSSNTPTLTGSPTSPPNQPDTATPAQPQSPVTDTQDLEAKAKSIINDNNPSGKKSSSKKMLLGGMVAAATILVVGGLVAGMQLLETGPRQVTQAYINCPPGSSPQEGTQGWCREDGRGCRPFACFDDETGEQVSDWEEACPFCIDNPPDTVCQDIGGNFQCVSSGGDTCEAPCQFVQGPGPDANATYGVIHYCENFYCAFSQDGDNNCAQRCDASPLDPPPGNPYAYSGTDEIWNHNSGSLGGVPAECFDRQIDWYVNSSDNFAGYKLQPKTLSGADCELPQPTPTPTPPPEAPTAEFSAACAPNLTYPDVIYDLQVSDISEGEFNSSTFYIGFTPNRHRQEIYNFLGTPTWGQQGDPWYGYSIYNCSPGDCAPVDGTIDFRWDDSVQIGSNGRTITDISNFIDELGSDFADYTFSIGANLVVNDVQNDQVGGANIHIRPTACAQPPDDPYACMSLVPSQYTPSLGESVTFTCNAGPQSSSIYNFRYRVDGSIFYDFDAVEPGSPDAVLQFTQPGHYQVQCQACLDNTGANCTPWDDI